MINLEKLNHLLKKLAILRGISMPMKPYCSNIISYSDSVNSFSGKLQSDNWDIRLHSVWLNRPELFVYMKSISTGSYPIFIPAFKSKKQLKKITLHYKILVQIHFIFKIDKTHLPKFENVNYSLKTLL